MTKNLLTVNSIEITVLVDNYTDLLLSEQTKNLTRPILPYGKTLLAEHGLSFFIRISQGIKTHHILMDCGSTDISLFHNADNLGINLEDIEEICISHGHHDHIGSLIALLQKAGTRIPVHIHPGAFVQRRKILPDGEFCSLMSASKDLIMHAGGMVVQSSEPSMIANGLGMLTGSVERTTDFELGSPILQAHIRGEWIHDPFEDDQSLIFHLEGKGLIIISGCAHSGIINSIRYAQKISGVSKIIAVIGGFHLSGNHFQKIIPDTISAMKEINPDIIIPLHCSGWNATHRFEDEMPGRVIINTVGTRYRFESESV